jgi:2-succinyl-6-hydroxy-2,4-cyclohexadiene-1-carboxylate synthase
LEPVTVPVAHRDAVPNSLPDDLAKAVVGRADGGAFSPYDTPRGHVAPDVVERLLDAVVQAERPLVLAGADPAGNSYSAALGRLAGRLGVPVLAEPTSGLRFVERQSDAVIGAGDLLLRANVYEELGEPDLILQLGKPPLHWAARELTARNQRARRITVTPSGRRLEPEHHPTWFVEADTLAVVKALLECAEQREVSESTGRGWLEAHRRAAGAAEDAIDASMAGESRLHEARIWRELGRSLPAHAAVFVSNSMPVRHFDTFLQGRAEVLTPYFNRGLNGIDGILSTGFGVAHARTVPTPEGGYRSNTVIVTGDVAFRHDVGALMMGRRLGVDATVVVCDNGGGGIFGALPIVDFEDTFEEHFLTPPGLHETDNMLGVAVAEPDSWERFAELLEESMSTPGLSIIRVRTDRADDEALASKHLGAACDAARGAVSGQALAANQCAVSSRGEPLSLVGLHGFSGSRRDWMRHADTLPSRQWVALDLPGHGPCPDLDRFEGRGLVDATAWLDDVLDARGLRPVHLAGYSMGGRIALAFALEYPEAVASLSLIGAHPGIRDFDERAERARWDQELAEKLETDGLHAFVDEWMRHPVLLDQLNLSHDAVLDARMGRLNGTTAGLARAFREFGTGSQIPMWEQLAALEVPTLFLAGADDAKYVRVGEEFAEHAPNARFATVDGAGHNALLENPEDTLAAIRDHIERAES